MMKRSLIVLRPRRQRPRPFALLLMILLAFDAVSFTSAFIVPEELPSILSLVYSNIPPIKKGTDSRLGFGFRLGEHADFQVQLELGPQLNTRPIGASSGSSKRYVDNDEYSNSIKTPNRNGGTSSWLQAWSKQTKQRQQFNKDKLRDSLMPPAPIMDEGAYNQLQQLYEMNKQREYEDSIGTLPAEVLEARIKQLKALHSPVVPFKPMPSEPRTGASGLKDLSEVSKQPSEQPNGTSASVIVVMPDNSTSTASDLTSDVSTTTKETAPSPTGSTVDGGRRNVRRRTHRPVNKRDKERITAQLSDVSLD